MNMLYNILYRLAMAWMLLLAASSISGAAEKPDSTARAKVKFAYDLDFEMNFDNREYDPSDIAVSGTIFGAKLTPAVGIAIHQKNGMTHRVMAGIDIMKDFGRSLSWRKNSSWRDTLKTDRTNENWHLFREITIYYHLAARFGKTDMNLVAGIFPKKFSQAEWPRSFISDSTRFYDNNFEGLLLTFRRPKSYYEFGCDWMGKYGKYERERFMIFSHGRGELLPWLEIGYSAYMYHYAGCEHVWGVVDNLLANPWISFDFAYMTPLQKLGITLGGLVSAQNDRRNIGKYTFPFGGELTFDIRKLNVGLQNRLFYGKDMMPYYSRQDAAGLLYADSLYFGDPFYRVSSSGKAGLYDRLEIYWQPHLADFVDLHVGVTAHFHNKGYSGLQQQVILIFNLSKLTTSLQNGAKR